MKTKSLPFLLGLALSLLALGLLGCVATQSARERDALLARGYPPAYADGYSDGYASGLAAAGNPYAQTTKNVDRYLQDEKYKVGWDDGFQKSKGRYEAIGRALR